MEVARTIARRSLCSRDQVGAVIVSRDNRIVDTGYNGPPRHHWPSRNGEPCARWCPRANSLILPGDYSNCDALHAEQNALMFSERRLREGGTIYVSSSVCGTCAKLIANSGLESVVYLRTEGGVTRNSDTWVAFMEQCGLTVVEYDAG
jgi:dCMP deaminase